MGTITALVNFVVREANSNRGFRLPRRPHGSSPDPPPRRGQCRLRAVRTTFPRRRSNPHSPPRRCSSRGPPRSTGKGDQRRRPRVRHNLREVVDKLQSDNKSKRGSWRTELPIVGLGRATIQELEEARSKDVS